MYRRTALILFVIFALWAAWMYSKDVAYERGKSIDFSEGTVESVMVSCGEAVPILFQGEFDAGVPESAFHMRSECERAARSHLGWIALFTLASLVFLVIGLVRGPAPKVPAIDRVLQRLPSPAQMREGAGTE
ncbi:MAG: hypothetical protein KQH83_11585 [Actinobacteria bacterium]|nr:hypothetical protein [Actinomycetota bacterium]